MKTTMSIIAVSLLLMFTGSNGISGTDRTSGQEPQIIRCTPDLYSLANEWTGEYSKLNPGIAFKVINVAESSAELGSGDGISIVSQKSLPALAEGKNWHLTLGHDITVPVVNAGNPYMNMLSEHGISPEAFSSLFSGPMHRNWSSLLEGAGDNPVNIYVVNEEPVKAGVSRFLKVSGLPYEGIILENREGVLAALKDDPYAIAFCNLLSIEALDGSGLTSGIKLLPIDKNGNGNLDYMENIYGDLGQFQRGVWIGKYPRALASSVYAVSESQPEDAASLAFLKWIVTGGQRYMNAHGISDIVNSERESQLGKINTAAVNIPPMEKSSSLLMTLMIVLASLIALSIVIALTVRRINSAGRTVAPLSVSKSARLDENAVAAPDGLYFDKTHTWAFMERDGRVTVGIDDFLQHVTGPITRVEMKTPGERIRKGELLLSLIQSGKQLNIYSPVSGTVKKQNEALISRSSYLNTSPYTQGWVYMVEPDNWYKELQLLDVASKYKNWIGTEFTRVKDFLAATLNPGSPAYAQVTLQDGGVLREGVLAGLGPEVWEDFQVNFLDTSK